MGSGQLFHSCTDDTILVWAAQVRYHNGVMWREGVWLTLAEEVWQAQDGVVDGKS